MFLFFLVLSKPYVFYIEKQMSQLKALVLKHKKDINLLKIEWTYLNQNARLQRLQKQLLPSWQPIEAKQLDSLPEKGSRNEAQLNQLTNDAAHEVIKNKSITTKDAIVKVSEIKNIEKKELNINKKSSIKINSKANIKNNIKIDNKANKKNIRKN